MTRGRPKKAKGEHLVSKTVWMDQKLVVFLQQQADSCGASLSETVRYILNWYRSLGETEEENPND